MHAFYPTKITKVQANFFACPPPPPTSRQRPIILFHVQAARNNAVDALKIFVEWASSSPNARAGLSSEDAYGSTPLHHAAVRDNVACAEMLIAAGSPVDARD